MLARLTQLKSAKRVPINARSSGFVSALTSSSRGHEAAYSAHESIGWLYSTVNRISESVAAVDWNLWKLKPDGKRDLVDDMQPPARHPFTALWSRPNPWFSGSEFRMVTQQHLELAGEAYWVMGKPDGRSELLELIPVLPERMHPVDDELGYPRGYVYVVGREKIPLELNQVVFLRVPSPRNPFRGLGPVQSMMTDLEGERFAAAWNRNFFQNSATPGGIIEVPNTLSDTEWEAMRTHWQEQHQGVSNAHRVAIVEGGSWKDRKATSQRDMEWGGMRRWNRDMIFGTFGMHASIMGVSEDVNRANAEAAEYQYAKTVLIPRLTRIRDAINTQVLPLFGDPMLQADFVDPTPSNRPAEIGEGSILWGAGLAQFNEARAIVGLPEDPKRKGEYIPVPDAPTRPGEQGQLNALVTGMKSLKAWPAELEEEEREIASRWEKRLDTVKREVLEYVERYRD